jgi:hypothetical protein
VSSFSLVRNFEYRHTEGSVGCHHRAIKKDFALSEELSDIARVVFHQEPLFIRHVLREGGPGWDQLEKVMLLVLANTMIAGATLGRTSNIGVCKLQGFFDQR